MPTTKSPALRCRSCGATGTDLTVETGQQHRRQHGKRRTAVNVRCIACGHSWWSTARAATDAAKAADRAAGR